MPPFIAYHNVDAATHQNHVDEFGPQGYRPVWLNVSGDPGNARYAAVWVKDGRIGWWAVHNIDATTYQQRFDALTAQGYVPSIVSVTGPVENAVFAAIFEAREVSTWFARHNLTFDPAESPDSLVHENNRAMNEGYLPRCLAVYGTAQDRRFAGVWWKNEDAVKWTWWLSDANFYQRVFDAELVGGMRPGSLAVADDHMLLSVFRGDRVGPWAARHRITAQEYQTEFDLRLSEGLRPIVVAAGGVVNNAQYAAVFAGQDEGIRREWHVTGEPSRGDNELDDAMRSVMVSLGVRSGALAVARGGELKVARGYTWAEPDYPITQPSTIFRMASLSKIFTCAALQALDDDNVLSLDTLVFPALGITAPLVTGQTVDPRINQVTARWAATERSGMLRDFGFTNDSPPRELTFRDVGRAVVGQTTSPTLDQVVQYLYGLPLRSDPGTQFADNSGYSNGAFHVLNALVQKVTGLPIDEFIRRRLLISYGLSDLFVASTRSESRLPGEVVGYDAPSSSPSQLDLSDIAWAADAYGGAVLTEVAPGTGGLATSVTTVARFIGAHAVWDLGGRTVSTRYGDFAGTGTGAHSRSDGLDLAFAFNFWVPDTDKDNPIANKNKLIANLDNILDQYAFAL
jgi:CubicO group peptidase (beta-lactamase class C family)